MAPLVPAWFDEVRTRLAAVPLAAEAACRMSFEAGASQWHLEIVDGRVRSFASGACEECDVRLRWTEDDAGRVLDGSLRGNDALAATTVEARDGRGEPYVGPPAPYNLSTRPELAAMPVIPNASLRVQYVYRDGPFGEVAYALTFTDGQLTDERLGWLDGPDVTVRVSYRTMALVRCGELSILEALEDGTIEGDVGAMALLAGISESRPFHDAELATGRHALALATLGDLDAQLCRAR